MRAARHPRAIVFALWISALACKSTEPTAQPARPSATGEATMPSITLSSSDFAPGAAMPKKLTCEGDDLSPALSWSGVPSGTKSLALIVDDPDAPDPRAPKMTWVHWVLFNIPPDTSALAAGAATGHLPEGARVGLNDWKRANYGGPCPPKGRHRYFHKLYALDTTLELDKPTKAQLESAMEGHILARGELVGTYQKAGF